MGRPPSSGGPAFRFNGAEVLEMETILQDYNNMMPAQEVLVAIADKFSNSQERQGKFVVQTKQIWNWFQNKRYAVRAKTSKTSTKLTVSSMQSMSTRAPLHSVPVLSTRPEVKATAAVPEASSASVISREDILSSSRLPQSAADSPGMIPADNTPMEFEARSARDGAWYDVASFLSLRNFEAGCPEVLVRFAGFGPEEDEWISVTTHVRHRSLPCESSECVAVLPGDLILCFQEGKEQALYFDAHVLDAQRRRHDARGCRCRFLVRYDHDQSEEIVPLRKICRRPETDYRLQQLHAIDESSAELRKSASSTEHMKSVSAKEQHKIVSSVEQIKTNVDSPYSKAGISQSIKSPAPVLLVSPSSISEEQKGATDCFTDKTTRDINAARSNSQQSHSHLEVINLDPETEVENDSHEVKNATNDMAVDEPLEKQTDIMPMCEIDATSTPNMIEEVRIEASLAAGTEHVPIAEQIDPELMIVETNSTTNEGKTNMDDGKDDMTSSTDTYVTGEASLPAVAGVNDVEGGAPELTSSICNMTLGQLVPEMSLATDAGKADIDSGNVTLTSTIDNVDDSGPSNSSTSNANVDNCFEKDAPTEEGIK